MWTKTSSQQFPFYPREEKTASEKSGLRSKSKFRRFVDHEVENPLQKIFSKLDLIPSEVLQQISRLDRVTLLELQCLNIPVPTTEPKQSLVQIQKAVYQQELAKIPSSPVQREVRFFQLEADNHRPISYLDQSNDRPSLDFDSQSYQLNCPLILDSDSSNHDPSARHLRTQNNIQSNLQEDSDFLFD